MRRTRKGDQDPEYERAKAAFAELGFDLDRDSVEAQSRRLGLGDPDPVSPYVGWQAFAAAVVPGDVRDPWDGDDVDPASWSAALSVDVLHDFELDPLELTLELEEPPSRATVERLTELLAAASRAAGTGVDGHISWWSEAGVTRLSSGSPGVRWSLDAASAGPRTIERLIDALVRGLVDLGVRSRRLIVGHLT
jgi:hypothetical protein